MKVPSNIDSKSKFQAILQNALAELAVDSVSSELCDHRYSRDELAEKLAQILDREIPTVPMKLENATTLPKSEWIVATPGQRHDHDKSIWLVARIDMLDYLIELAQKTQGAEIWRAYFAEARASHLERKAKL